MTMTSVTRGHSFEAQSFAGRARLGNAGSAPHPHLTLAWLRRRKEASMSYGFLDIAATPNVKAAQAANGADELWSSFDGDRTSDRFTEAEAAFIAQRDSFYMASVSESGWPYVQHRGGPPGFLVMLDDQTLAFADFRGNRQYISVGNLAGDDRVALILMDYAGRRRLKLYAHASLVSLADEPELWAMLELPGYRAKPERAIRLRLAAFDWNCPQHITPRFTEAEVARAVEPLTLRLQELEAENAALRAAVSRGRGDETTYIRE
jgi:predicted pyridoxine 5'-phosphate oxidase superfamily flavin-nucleotide-binding protein